MALGSSITGIDVVDVVGLQSALDLKAPKESPAFTATVTGTCKGMVGLGDVDNPADKYKPLSDATVGMFTVVAGAF